MKTIYLDHAATSPMHREVIDVYDSVQWQRSIW